MLEDLKNRFRTAYERERRTTFRYLLVGSSSFGVKAVSYAALSRLIWETGNRTIENALAVLVSMVYNYTLHRFWTFRHQQSAPGSMLRYVIVVVSASLLDVALFNFLHYKFGFYDFGVVFFNGVAIAGLGFVSHRLFTFHSNPWKRKTTIAAAAKAEGKKPDDVVQSV